VVTVTNSSNVTSANKIADATDKGVVCINTSVAVTNIIAVLADDVGNQDRGNGNSIAILSGIQGQLTNTSCAGSQAWIRTYGPDGHRTSDLVTIYVIFQ
jgi:hypothetical protein